MTVVAVRPSVASTSAADTKAATARTRCSLFLRKSRCAALVGERSEKAKGPP
jgi:hypothetical protein